MFFSMTLLSETTLATLSDVLSGHGIRHGRLRDVSTATNLNLHAHDGSAVFVKVSRIGVAPVTPHVELSATAWAWEQGLAPVRPLHTEPLPCPDGRSLNVFAYGDFLSAPSLFNQAEEIADLLTRLHALPVPGLLPVFDPSGFAAMVENRLGTRTGRDADLLREAVADAAAILAEHLDPARFVALHGDAHVDNLVWGCNGRGLLVDWEGACAGPAEWDAGQLVRTLLVQQPSRTTAYRVAAAERALAAFAHLNPHLVEATIRIRSCTWAALLLARGLDRSDPALADALALAEHGTLVFTAAPILAA